MGDIIDGWQLRRQWYWPQSHNDVVQKLLRKAREGTRVVFVPGNHDRKRQCPWHCPEWPECCGRPANGIARGAVAVMAMAMSQ